MESVEIRYLDIVWNDKRQILKVEESNQSIELEIVNEQWCGDAVTYPKKYFHIGLCIVGELLHEPYLKLSNDEVSPLMPIKVPGENKTWWIQKGDWDKKHKKYRTSIYRTAGHIEMTVQNETIILHNHTSNFSLEDLEYYLSDLKGKLWMLMLDNKSASKVSIQKEIPTALSDDTLQLFSDLALSIETITRKPHVNLFETQQKLPRRSVKPVIKTFREIATQSNPKLLTSRSYIESYNTPENRFVHYLALRALYLIKALSRVAALHANSMRDKAQRDEHWLRTESDRRTKIVDPVVLDNELEAISSEIKKQSDALSEALKKDKVKYSVDSLSVQTYALVLGKKYSQYDTRYFVEELDGKKFKQTYRTYLVLSSSINFEEVYKDMPLGGYEFRVTGAVRKSKETNSNGKKYYRIHFSSIHAIDVIRSPLEREFSRLKNARKRLENNGWIANLSRDELADISNQVEIARGRLGLINRTLELLGDFISEAPSVTMRLKRTVQFFRKHNVKLQQDSPNSMVFSQNPMYSSVKSIYRKISNLDGVSDSLLSSMMAIDDIGLVNLPALYERWCLVQLINVICDVYQFKMLDGWQQNLIDAVLKNHKNIEINFSCRRRQLSLRLTYEKELVNGKRPDYVIDLMSFPYSHNVENSPLEQDPSSPVRWYAGKQKVHRMVVDAKFRGDVREQHIDNLIEELYHRKNYSENDKNAVFVIHPVAKITDNRTSPLEWGLYCNYGQSLKLNHKKGAVYLSPTREHNNSIENLQRLIGMLLQIHTTILDDGKREAVTWHNKCCISCGSSDLNIKLSATQRGNDVNKIECNKCGQKTIETQCVSCERRLFKNGINWTYHRTRAEQTTNIVCPECETFL